MFNTFVLHLYFSGRQRPCDLLAKSLRMADGEYFDDPSLLHCSADRFIEMINVEELKDLLSDAESHLGVCQSAAQSDLDFVESSSWTKEMEQSANDEGPDREALVRHQKFWSALLLVGTVR